MEAALCVGVLSLFAAKTGQTAASRRVKKIEASWDLHNQPLGPALSLLSKRTAPEMVA